jgi:hypothetical protein
MAFVQALPPITVRPTSLPAWAFPCSPPAQFLATLRAPSVLAAALAMSAAFVVSAVSLGFQVAVNPGQSMPKQALVSSRLANYGTTVVETAGTFRPLRADIPVDIANSPRIVR